MRTVLSVVAGAAVAALSALLLGEYPFSGLVVIAAGLIAGLFVAEAYLAVSRQPGWAAAVTSGLLAAGAMVWAAWISTGHELGQLNGLGWVAVAAGGTAAAVRAGWRRAADNRRAPSRTE